MVRTFKSQEEEIEAVGVWIADRGREGVMPHEFGVFVRSDAQLGRARAAVAKAGLPYKIVLPCCKSPSHVLQNRLSRRRAEAGMRAAQGSATVAIITAAGIIAPLMKSMPGVHPEMMYLAVCCGRTMLSHVNDAGFWIVNQYFGMTVPQTLESWTAMKIVTSICGFGLLLLFQLFLWR